MAYLDIILLIILGIFTLLGFWFGFIRTLGSLLGTIAGAFLTCHLYAPVANWLWSLTGGNLNLIKVIVFILLFAIISRLIGFVFWLAEKVFHVLKIIPFLGIINRLLGGLLGLIEGSLVLGLILFFISQFPFNSGLTAALTQSPIASLLIGIFRVLWLLIQTYL